MKEENTYQKRYSPSKDKRWLSREQTLGIIDSESCLFDTKRKLRIILDWCYCLAVLSSIER